MPGEVTYAEIATKLRSLAYERPNDWRMQLFALADRLEAEDAAGLEAIMRAVQEQP